MAMFNVLISARPGFMKLKFGLLMGQIFLMSLSSSFISKYITDPGNGGPNLVSFTVASVRCWGIHAPQQLTGGLSYDTSFNMWAGGGGEDANRRPQRLSGTSEVPKGGAPSDRHRKPWADRPGTALHAKTEVPSRRKLDVEIL